MERIKKVVEQILNRVPVVRGKGEEATKQAIVLPMLDALGYDIWHPGEVCPEYEADFASKKLGQKEKVDIALLLQDAPRIYIEVKSLDTPLDGHEGQLARYFNATPTVTLAALTNGIEWRFFTDTGDPNVMDAQPFHVTRLDAAEQGLEVLARFAKPVFSPEAIRDFATELRYTAQIAAFLRSQLDLGDRDPSEQFMRWVLKSEGMYQGVVNANVIERFNPIVKAALTQVLRAIVRRSIAAMEEGTVAAAPAAGEAPRQQAVGEPPGRDGAESTEIDADGGDGQQDRGGIVTTEDELRIFAVAKEMFERSALASRSIWDSSVRKDVPVAIGYKDTQAYFGVYLNKPAWWVFRAGLSARVPWVAFNVDPAVGAGLVPPNAKILQPYGWAPFRVQVGGPGDLPLLHTLFFATCERLIEERQRPRMDEHDKGTDGQQEILPPPSE